MNEWEFTANVASWINRILSNVPSLPFSSAKCEQQNKGSQKRRDLTLLDRNGVVVLTGEVKLPYQKNGGSPYNAEAIKDARLKARRAKSNFFFTWNVNEFVLWETTSTRIPLRDQNFKAWDVTAVHKESHLELPMTEHAIQCWLAGFLDEFAQIQSGTKLIGHKAPDEKFIEALESSLRMPIIFTVEKLDEKYKNPRFKSELDKWMRDEQGWIIYDDPEGIRDNMERAAKFACYALVNKLVFHEALLKRYSAKMSKLTVHEYTNTGDELRSHLEGYFEEAKVATSDYETVFGEGHASVGNRIPFYSDKAVTYWRELINQIHDFDFSKLDYEVIGNIFERLISPEERHKYGQFYTKVEVVDLINSFCIRSGDAKVIDPASGGGTFLVRAYVRKRELSPSRKHGQLLHDIFGVDISHFATHLTTINLAARNLVDDENYPQIARSDFFDVEANKTFLTLPTPVKTKGLGITQSRDVNIPPLDAVVGNPPYIRQEDIPKSKKKKSGPDRGTKEHYLKLVEEESNASLSGRSDIHCYFWPHAASFLKNDGYLGFLTSSQWLDVEYGFRLQKWILSNFEIVAIIESVDEPWFVGARVATTVTILKLQQSEKKRMENVARFVQLRRPINEILAHDGTTGGAISIADDFRDEILALKKNTTNDRYRARLVLQRDMWEQGVELGRMMGKGDAYYGGKWGAYVRAPDLWFDIVEKYGDRMTHLGKIADVRFGVKSGADEFFFPKDVSRECINSCNNPDEFAEEFGVSYEAVNSGKLRLVQCGKGKGEIRPIEAKYLEPEIHSLMEIDGYSVAPDNCSRHVLLVGLERSKLKDRYIREYIKWGESNNYHRGSTCVSRVSVNREWYDLTGHRRGALFWPKSQQYKHVVPINDNRILCNCNLYDVTTELESDLLGGILNSTIVVFSKFQYGRPVGVEGNFKTEVVDVKMMLVPDPTQGTKKARKRVENAFEKLKERKAYYFLSERRLREMRYIQLEKENELDKLSDVSELDMPDRRELDDAVLEMLGIAPKAQRKRLLDEIYDYLRYFFELTRRKEEKAILNKRQTRRRGAGRPIDIATQIFKDILDNYGNLFRKYDFDFLDKTRPFNTYEIPAEGAPAPSSDVFGENWVVFSKGKRKTGAVRTRSPEQSKLITLVVNSGRRGFLRVPCDENECEKLYQEYERFIKRRRKKILELIEERTADEDVQEKVYTLIMNMILAN